MRKLRSGPSDLPSSGLARDSAPRHSVSCNLPREPQNPRSSHLGLGLSVYQSWVHPGAARGPAPCPALPGGPTAPWPLSKVLKSMAASFFHPYLCWVRAGVEPVSQSLEGWSSATGRTLHLWGNQMSLSDLCLPKGLWQSWELWSQGSALASALGAPTSLSCLRPGFARGAPHGHGESVFWETPSSRKAQRPCCLPPSSQHTDSAA